MTGDRQAEFLTLLQTHVPGLTVIKDQATGHVPWREDAHPSLTADLEQCVWYDRARGEGGGLKDFKARLSQNPQPARRIVAKYDYHDENGSLLYQVVRYDPKGFAQRQPDGKGGWSWKLDGVRRVLYRLDEIAAAETLYLVEGEKDADRLWALGLPATCNPGGVGKWQDVYSQALAGKTVILLPDNDEPGAQHAHQVARSVLPHAAAVKIVRLPGLPPKGDVSDWLDADHTQDDLTELVTAAPILTPADVPPEQPALGASMLTRLSKELIDTPWLDPQPLPDGLQPVLTLDERLIPAPFRPWLVDIAERMQCPLDYPTVGAIVAWAGLVGRRVGIRPKRRDDWLVVPNLWGAIIGRPGLLKTPALAEVLKPLQRLEIQARAHYEQELERADIEKLTNKARQDALAKHIRDAVRQNKEPDQAKIDALSSHAHPEPTLTRYIVNDSTVEKLGVILNENPTGVLYFRDELTGFLRTLDKDGRENDRAFYLEAWNGNSSYTYDRINRGTLYIDAACVSILGGIQPGPLAAYLRGAAKGGGDDDGLIQRFQLMVYPDDPGPWRNVDRWPDSKAKERAFKLFDQLSTLQPAALQAQVPEGKELPFLQFSNEGQEHFNAWRNDLEQKIRLPDHPVLEAHFSKYRSLMPSLALLFHLLTVMDTGASGDVSLQAAQQAAAWCDYLELHARRIYQGVTQHALFAARTLAERIKAGKLRSPFTPHDVYHNGWTGLSTTSDVEEAAEILEELAWLRSERVPAGTKGGRPRFHYWINPQLIGEEVAA